MFKTPLEITQMIAKQAGDPMPDHAGGPDSQAMVDWHTRWGMVERLLKLHAASEELYNAVKLCADTPEFDTLLEEYEYQRLLLNESIKDLL